MIAADFSTELSDMAICHRNAKVDGADCIFISTRLMQDRFALSFEFYINAGHHFVDAVGVPESFMRLVWSQAEANVRGETSQDAWEQSVESAGSNSAMQSVGAGNKTAAAEILDGESRRRSRRSSKSRDR